MATPENVATALKELETQLNFIAAGNLTKNQMKERAEEALGHFKVVSNYIATTGQDTRAVARREAAERKTPDDEGSNRIEDFLQTVGRGARKAQEQLDALSMDYIENRPFFAPETMFRIPKVSANLKLGMRQTESKEIDFFVIGRETEDTKFVEQEINFEIVAAPPPPDALEGLSPLPIGSLLVTSAIGRSRIWARLEEEKERKPKLEDASVVGLIEEMSSEGATRRVLALQGETAWTLLLVEPPEARKADKPQQAVAMLRLPFDKEAGRPETFPAGKNVDKIKQLYQLLIPVADRQAELLADLNRP